jgi:hypothetical protein
MLMCMYPRLAPTLVNHTGTQTICLSADNTEHCDEGKAPGYLLLLPISCLIPFLFQTFLVSFSHEEYVQLKI